MLKLYNLMISHLIKRNPVSIATIVMVYYLVLKSVRNTITSLYQWPQAFSISEIRWDIHDILNAVVCLQFYLLVP